MHRSTLLERIDWEVNTLGAAVACLNLVVYANRLPDFNSILSASSLTPSFIAS